MLLYSTEMVMTLHRIREGDERSLGGIFQTVAPPVISANRLHGDVGEIEIYILVEMTGNQP